MIWRDCEYCGGPFTTYPSVVKLGRGRFCGRRCARLYERYGKRNLGPRYESGSKKITRYCEVCGEPFQVTPSETAADNRECCGNECKFTLKTLRALERRKDEDV